MSAKVFGIGLNKTGTSTLGACLTTLGYRHRSYSLRQVQRLRTQQWDALLADYAAADSFDDVGAGAGDTAFAKADLDVLFGVTE